MEMEGGLTMVAVELGYYIRDTGDGDVCYFFMTDAASGAVHASRRRVGAVDGFYLMDKIISGDPDMTGPVPVFN
jgi:hypothetical protein